MDKIRRATDEIARAAGAVPPVDESQRVLAGGGTEADRPNYTEHKSNGQQRDYVVLSEEERARGFVRPVRDSYVHVGMPQPRGLRDLTAEEHERYDRFGYVKYEDYGPERSPLTGRFWTQADLDKIGKGCGALTRMSREIAETYARDPKFYGSTFCVGCRTHLPVGEYGEFVWDGTNERVGT